MFLGSDCYQCFFGDNRCDLCEGYSLNRNIFEICKPEFVIQAFCTVGLRAVFSECNYRQLISDVILCHSGDDKSGGDTDVSVVGVNGDKIESFVFL